MSLSPFDRTLTPARLDELRGEWDVVPRGRRLSADTLTPVAAFSALSGFSVEAFLLESVERGENVGRYSFIGVAPRRRMVFGRDGSIGEEGRSHQRRGDAVTRPADVLREETRPLRVFGEAQLPPFFGGAVGFFGYGVARWSERLPDRHEEPAGPDATLLFFDQVVAFDHVRQELFVVANIFSGDPESSERLLGDAEGRLDAIIAALKLARVDLVEASPSAACEFRSNLSREQFVTMVKRAREEIAAGEIFQVVLSQRWETPFPTGEALRLYRALRTVNPSPYMFLLRTRECVLVGSSPEMLVRLEHGVAQTRPIAGTRRRGADVAEDDRFEKELRGDEKENAEHLMLVDLGRNDLGRVCAAASVEVTQFCAVERYSHVMHLVSNVSGRLAEGVSATDLLLSAFPAGTVSGAPKIRAMELIDALEPERRGLYAGAIAYFGFSGALDSCIAIRTIVLRDERAWVQAGAGIVFDSDPEKEFEETVSKSAALRKAIEKATAMITAEVGAEC
jgi:anthranilate synthase component 1